MDRKERAQTRIKLEKEQKEQNETIKKNLEKKNKGFNQED